MSTLTRYIVLPLACLCLPGAMHVGFAQSPETQPGMSGASPSFIKVSLVPAATDRANSHGASWVDYDNDGDLDLFVANIDGTGNFLYQNDGAGSWNASRPAPSRPTR